MYNHAKRITGKSIGASDLQTEEGHAFRSAFKAELPASTAKPQPQIGPVEALQPTAKQRGRLPAIKTPTKASRLPGLKVNTSELGKSCNECGCKSFQGNTFKGCMCVRDSASHVRTTTYNDGVVLDFGPEFNPDLMSTLRKALKD
jgi:hypothetical protein